MTKYIWHNGGWVRAIRALRPSMFPSIITDAQPALMHPANGKYYDSKSEFRRVTREHGLVELGNDAPLTPPEFKPEGVREDIVKSMQMLEQGYRPDPVETVGQIDGQAVETRIYE